MSVSVLHGDCLEVLRTVADGAAQMCITSPPYWGLRDYGDAGREWPAMAYCPMAGLPEIEIPSMRCPLGLEPTPEAYIGHLVLVFREVRRVLRNDGTLWLNLGDTFSDGGSGANTLRAMQTQRRQDGLKQKDLCGIPWRAAFALQADGWWLRMDNIWAKPNPMPESVLDRCTKAHEYVFLLTKSQRYYYDAEAVSEPMVSDGSGGLYKQDASYRAATQIGGATKGHRVTIAKGRNKRSVWTITTKPYSGAHFAVMPPALAEVAIRAGSKPGDTVLDPFGGAFTSGVVADALGRDALLCEQSADYIAIGQKRLEEERAKRGQVKRKPARATVAASAPARPAREPRPKQRDEGSAQLGLFAGGEP